MAEQPIRQARQAQAILVNLLHQLAVLGKALFLFLQGQLCQGFARFLHITTFLFAKKITKLLDFYEFLC